MARRDAGYRYVNIDDGRQGTRGPDGALRRNARFPDMKALGDYVHARRLKLGIYNSPRPKNLRRVPWQLRPCRAGGALLCSMGRGLSQIRSLFGRIFLPDRDSIRRVFQQMGAALRATRRPMLYRLCEYRREKVGEWGRAAGGHLWRTTGEIVDRYDVMAGIGFD
ncbi:hypothetical protein ACVWZA_004148 [Sphingomonas sp. UYAg733]